MIELEHQIIHLEYIKTLLQTGSKTPDFEKIRQSFTALGLKPPSLQQIVEEFKEVYQWARSQGLKTVQDFSDIINTLQNKLLSESKNLKEVFVDTSDLFPPPVSGHRATNTGIGFALTQDDYFQIIEIIKEYYAVGQKSGWFQSEEGVVVTDASAQMGVFGVLLAQNFDFVNLIESHELSYEITRHNVQLHDPMNVSYYFGQALDVLEKIQTDVLYIDSRSLELDLSQVKQLLIKCLVILSPPTTKYDNIYHVSVSLSDMLTLYFWFPKGYNINKIVASDMDITELLKRYHDKYANVADPIGKFKTLSVKNVCGLLEHINRSAIRQEAIDMSDIDTPEDLWIVMKSIVQVLKDGRTFEKLWYYYKNQLQRQKQQNPELYILENLEHDIQPFLVYDIDTIIDELTKKYKYNMNVFYTEITELVQKYAKREQEKVYSDIKIVNLQVPKIQWISAKHKLIVQKANEYSMIIDDMLSENINKSYSVEDLTIGLSRHSIDTQAYETRVNFYTGVLSELTNKDSGVDIKDVYNPIEWGVSISQKKWKSVIDREQEGIDFIKDELEQAKKELITSQEAVIAIDMLSKYLGSGDIIKDTYFNILRTQVYYHSTSIEQFTDLKKIIANVKETRDLVSNYISGILLRINEMDLLVQICNDLLYEYEEQKNAVTTHPRLSELSSTTIKEISDILSQKPRNVIKDIRKLANSINREELIDINNKLEKFDEYFRSVSLFFLHVYVLSDVMKTFEISVPKVIKQELTKVQAVYSGLSTTTKQIPTQYLSVLSLEYIRFMIYFVLNFKTFVSDTMLQNVIESFKIDDSFRVQFMSLSAKKRLQYIVYLFDTLEITNWLQNFDASIPKYSEISESIEKFKSVSLEREIGDCGCKYYETHLEDIEKYSLSVLQDTYLGLDFHVIFRKFRSGEYYDDLVKSYKLNFSMLSQNLEYIENKYSVDVKNTLLEIIITEITSKIVNNIREMIMCTSVSTMEKIRLTVLTTVKNNILISNSIRDHTRVELSKDYWCPCLNYSNVTDELEYMILRFTINSFSHLAVVDAMTQWIQLNYKCILTRDMFIQHFSGVYDLIQKSDEEQIQFYLKKYSEIQVDQDNFDDLLQIVQKLQAQYPIDKYLGFTEKSLSDLTEYYTGVIKNPSVFIPSNNEIYSRLLALKSIYVKLYKPKYKEASKKGSELEAIKNYISERYNLQTITNDDISKSLEECLNLGYISIDTVQFVKEFMTVYNDFSKLPSGISFEPKNVFDLKRYSDFPRVLQTVIQEMYTMTTTNVDTSVQDVIQESIVFNGITESLQQKNPEGAITWAMHIPNRAARDYIVERIQSEDYIEVNRYLQIIQETYRYKMSFTQSIGKIYSLIQELPTTEHSVLYAIDFLSVSPEEKQELKELVIEKRYTRLNAIFLQKFPMLQSSRDKKVQLQSSFFPSSEAKRMLLQSEGPDKDTSLSVKLKNDWSLATERCFHLIYYKPWSKINLKNARYFIAPVDNDKIIDLSEIDEESRVLFGSQVYFSEKLYHPSEYFWNLYCMNQLSVVCNPVRNIRIDSQECAVISLSNLQKTQSALIDVVIGIYVFTNSKQKSSVIELDEDPLMQSVVYQYEKLRGNSEIIPLFCSFTNDESMILKAIYNLLHKQSVWLGRQYIDMLDIQTIARYLIPSDIKIELKLPDDITSAFDTLEKLLTNIGYPNGYTLILTIYRVIQKCRSTKQKLTNPDLSRVLRECGLQVPQPEILSTLCLHVVNLIKMFESKLNLQILEEKLMQRINPVQYFLHTVPNVSVEKMRSTIECLDKMFVQLGLNTTGSVIDMLCRLFLNIINNNNEEILKNVKIFY